MDTLALALALMMDGRTVPNVGTIATGNTWKGVSRDSVTLVKPETLASLETRAKVAMKTPNVWGE